MSGKKILIADDEPLARDRIRRFLSELKISHQLDEATNGIEALEKLNSNPPDIVFLDVQMPGLTGFELLQQTENRNFHLIFQTAYDEYAIKAFEENACDYLLKPFNFERFEKAMGKALRFQSQKEELNKLEFAVQKKQGFLEKIAVKQSGKMKIVEMALVDCFISRDHYTCIYCGDKELTSELSLKWLEDRIDPDNFIRCHRNSIISVKQIKEIGGVNNSEILLKNGMRVPLSRGNRKAVLELLN